MGFISILCSCSLIILFAEIEKSSFFPFLFDFFLIFGEWRRQQNEEKFTRIHIHMNFELKLQWPYIMEWTSYQNDWFFVVVVARLVLFIRFSHLLPNKINETCTVWFRICSFYPAYDRLPEHLYNGHWTLDTLCALSAQMHWVHDSLDVSPEMQSSHKRFERNTK